MAVDATQYPVFVSYVTSDSQEALYSANLYYQLDGGPSGRYVWALNWYNRDQALLGLPPYPTPAPGYITPTSFADLGLTPISIPSNAAIPPLSADLLAQVQGYDFNTLAAAVAAGAPVAPSTPVTSTSTPATSSSGGSSGTARALDLSNGGAQSYCDLFPDDPLCGLDTGDGGFDGTPIGGVSTGSNSVSITIVNEGVSGTDVATSVDNALGKLWDAVVGAVDAVVADAVGALQDALTALGNALKAAYAILSRLAGFILNALAALWQDIVKGIVAILQALKTLLAGLYNDVLVPLLKGIQNIRQALLDVYQRFIRPMLIVLQDIRQFLAILSAFHISFAQKLDAKLTQLEAKITQPLFYLLSFVNGVANWVNLIITAGYLLQKSVFLNSLLAYVGEALNLQINAMNPTPDPAAVAAAAAAATPPTPAQTAADFSQFLATGTGNFAPVIAQNGALLDQYLAQGVS
jgi:hypothetical protein